VQAKSNWSGPYGKKALYSQYASIWWPYSDFSGSLYEDGTREDTLICIYILLGFACQNDVYIIVNYLILTEDIIIFAQVE